MNYIKLAQRLAIVLVTEYMLRQSNNYFAIV